MVYKFTKLEVLRDLRIKIIKQESCYKIAKIAENLLQERIRDEDPALEQFLIDLACMQSGLEYELSYEELEDKLDTFYMGDDFVYDRLEFAKELRRKIKKRVPALIVGTWVFDMYYDYMFNIDRHSDLGKLLLELEDIEKRSEFECSYEELSDIVDRLIEGEGVKL